MWSGHRIPSIRVSRDITGQEILNADKAEKGQGTIMYNLLSAEGKEMVIWIFLSFLYT